MTVVSNENNKPTMLFSQNWCKVSFANIKPDNTVAGVVTTTKWPMTNSILFV